MNSAAFEALSPAERDAYFEREARSYRQRKAAGASAPAPDVEPLPLRRPAPPGEPFPVDALGPTLGGAVEAIAGKVQCAPGLAAGSVLAAASLAAQAHADVILPATGQMRPLSLFLVSVAATGDRKSSADSEAMRPPRQREKALREIYDLEKRDFLHAKRAYEIALANAEKKAKGDRYEIEEALRGVGDPPPEPLLPFLLCNEPTLEGLQKLFEKGQPSLGLCSDEGGGFIGGHAMSAENRLKTLAGLSQFWDGATVRRNRAGDGSSVLIGRRLALHLMVQPGAASGLLADAVALDQGFLSRVLVQAPPSLAGSRLQKPLEPETESGLRRYEGALRELLEKPMPVAPGSANVLEPRSLSFDAQAKSSWLRLCDAIETKLGPGGDYEPIRGFANKLAEHIARLAGVLALVDNPEALEIDAGALASAVELGDYFASEALRLFEVGSVSPEVMQAEKALAWLQATAQEAFGLAALYQGGPNCLRDAATARKALETLERNYWVTRLEGNRHVIEGKTVREAWRLNKGKA